MLSRHPDKADQDCCHPSCPLCQVHRDRLLPVQIAAQKDGTDISMTRWLTPDDNPDTFVVFLCIWMFMCLKRSKTSDSSQASDGGDVDFRLDDLPSSCKVLSF